MRVLFVHQNMPAQYKHLARVLSENRSNQVVFVSQRQDPSFPRVRTLLYKPSRAAHDSTHHYVRRFENAVLHGQQVVRTCQELIREKFVPDIIIAHPGWGETLFLKDVFPKSPILSFCEFYYIAKGGDIGFDPAEPPTLDVICRARARNAHLLLALEACDRGISPTKWQRSVHPKDLQSKIEVIFDGVDTNLAAPDPAATFTLPSGRTLTRSDTVVTYVARNLEPYRGYPTFIRSLPEVLSKRPDAQVVIVGADGVSYGSAPDSGKTWREEMAAEVPLDPNRVHFVGRLPYDDYLRLLKVSSAHVYLTVPFALSWSFMESMASGCLVVGSDTAPVREVIQPGRNGLLVDFFSPSSVAKGILKALGMGEDAERLRAAARETVLAEYSLDVCLPRQLKLIQEMRR